MLENLANIMTEVMAFTNNHKIEAEFHLYYIRELQDKSDSQAEYWARFEKNAGVYCIFDSKESHTKYIGMSEKDTGSRLFYWLFKENKLAEKLLKDDIILSIVLRKEPYMASALETYLIREIPTLHNVRKLEKIEKND